LTLCDLRFQLLDDDLLVLDFLDPVIAYLLVLDLPDPVLAFLFELRLHLRLDLHFLYLFSRP
jgi:hypothetical protein